MILERDKVFRALLRCGLLEHRELVQRGAEVVPMSARNTNFRVSVGGRPRCFVKQLANPDGRGRRTLRHEADRFRRYAADSRQLPHLARVLHYDSDQEVLVTEFLPGNSLIEIFRRHPEQMESSAKELGRALGTLHATTVVSNAPRDSDPGFPEERPGLLMSEDLAAPLLASRCPGQARFGAMVRKYPRVSALTREVSRRWRSETLIHNDVKLANGLYVSDEGEGRAVLIDWEFARWGDAAWDIGGAIQSMLAMWFAARRPTLRSRGPRLAFSQVKSVIGCCWRAYRAARSDLATRTDVERLATRSAAFAGARLIQTGHEWQRGRSDVGPVAIDCLQAAINLMSEPEKHARDLLETKATCAT